MSSPAGSPSLRAPKGGSVGDELSYYKSQYEQLEVELQEFQASSKELEAELEKDIEESEKRERSLHEKVEGLRFEVDEWKNKYKQSKAESGNAQNLLQKEITTLRDSNRTLQLKLRDIEVANDDFERQARNQTSSLEDLESKYNMAIERGVIFEEEIRLGEQEREELRIESQRLRDELSDLKVEVEIVQGKLRHAEATRERDRDRERKVSPLATESLSVRAPSPLSEASTSATTASSPLVSTPPPSQSQNSEIQTTPPSPPLSEGSAKPVKKLITPTTPITPLPFKRRTAQPATTATPRNLTYSGVRPPRHSRGPSIPTATIATSSGRATPSGRQSLSGTTATKTPGRIPPPSRASILMLERPPPRSGSLNQIRGLIGKMQKLEQRVQTARSKLPAPTTTPPRASPRPSLNNNNNNNNNNNMMPSSVTVRSARKRASNSTTSSVTNNFMEASSSGRQSFGFVKPSLENHAGYSGGNSRPSSRASQISVSGQYPRPNSRASLSNIRAAAGYAIPTGTSTTSVTSTTTGQDLPRPRSSISGNYAALHSPRVELTPRSNTPGPTRTTHHSFSRSVSGVEDYDAFSTPVTARRSTIERNFTAIPSSLPRRQSGGFGFNSTRRQSGAGPTGDGEMRPPSSRGVKRLSEVGETF